MAKKRLQEPLAAVVWGRKPMEISGLTL